VRPISREKSAAAGNTLFIIVYRFEFENWIKSIRSDTKNYQKKMDMELCRNLRFPCHVALSRCSGSLTRGYAAPDLAGLPPKLP